MPDVAASSFDALVGSPIRFRMFLLRKLPAAYFSGVRLVSYNGDACAVSVPYKRFSQNPFRSTYFACLSMAAEMSTGILAMSAIYKRTPAVSMLITGMRGQFHKKAKTLTTFTCTDGAYIRNAVETAIDTGAPQQLTIHVEGLDPFNQLIAEFWFTWSFKEHRISSKE